MQTLNVLKLRTKRGFILNAFAEDSITKEVQRKGEYDSNTLNSLSDILAAIKPEISLDVGANIGNHVLVISKFSQHVVAFEPVKFIFDVLKKNVEENYLDNVTPLNLGLSNKDSESEIFIPKNGNLGSSSMEAKGGEGVLLKIKTIVGDVYLEDNFKDQHVDFIKMDVEGHEAFALMGLKAVIAKYQPLILLEWKSPNTIQTFREFDLFNKLFPEYKKYSLSYTSNKKVHANSIAGFLRRIYHKLIGSKWCLSRFDDTKYYTNVYFVPLRYQKLFNNFNYLD